MMSSRIADPETDWSHRQIRVRADFLLDRYPAPPEVFRRTDVVSSTADWEYERHRQLLSYGAFVVRQRPTSTQAGRYSVDPDAWQLAQETVANRDAPLPCGHAGLSCHGDHYSCTYDGCDREFDRADIAWGDGDD